VRREVYVLDASVYAPLLILLGPRMLNKPRDLEFVILDLTVYEACNAFWKEHRKLRRITAEEAAEACSLASSVSKYLKLYRVDSLDTAKVMQIAVENNMTFYDAAYIMLAADIGAAVASEDRDILSTAPRYNIKTLRLRDVESLLSQAG
jgi:predicted nucleic acid-binding protein